MKCEAVALSMLGHPEGQRGPCDRDLAHDGPHRHHDRGLNHEWSSPSYRVERRSPIVRDEPWWKPPTDTGECSVVVAPAVVEAWMTVAAYFQDRMHEAVVVCPAEGVVRVGVCSDQPVKGDPVLYDQWSDVEIAGEVWVVARAVCDGRITWASAEVEPEPFEQLDLLAMEGTQ